MKFGEKLKKLRKDNNLTQDELAEKLFVTRTAISKWETDKGYPGIDSLKQISTLFGISIDELISDSDIENKRVLEEKYARRVYFCALALFVLTVLFALLAYFLKNQYYNIGSCIAIIGFVFCALFSKPKYKRKALMKNKVSFILSRILIFVIVAGAVVTKVLKIIY